MKPIIKYPGGKRQEIPYILPRIPSYAGRYVEPFFGGGAVFFALEPQNAIIGDTNERLMSFYRQVRDSYNSLKSEIDELSFIYNSNESEYRAAVAASPQKCAKNANEELYYAIRRMFNEGDEIMYSDAAMFYFLNKTAFSGLVRTNRQGEFNAPFGRYKKLDADALSEAHSRLLQKTTVLCGDYSDTLRQCRADDFVFLDPPYDSVFTNYGNGKNFEEDDHERLAAAFRALPCKAMLVIGKTPLTERLYAGMDTCVYSKRYALNAKSHANKTTEHMIITNYSYQNDAYDNDNK